MCCSQKRDIPGNCPFLVPSKYAIRAQSKSKIEYIWKEICVIWHDDCHDDNKNDNYWNLLVENIKEHKLPN